MKTPLDAYTMGSSTNGMFDPAIKPGGDLDRFSIDLSAPENYLLQRELTEFAETAVDECKLADVCSPPPLPPLSTRPTFFQRGGLGVSYL